MYIFGRNLIFKGLFLKETLYEVFSSLNVKEVQKFWTFDFLFKITSGFCQNCISPLVSWPLPWAHDQSKGLQRCGPKMKLGSHILCSRQCKRMWGNEPTHTQVGSHFGNWNSDGLPNFRKKFQGPKLINSRAPYTIERFLKRRFLTWARMTHLST